MPRPAPLIAAALAAGLVLTACQKPEVSGPPVSPTALPSSTPTAPSVGTTAPTAASSPASPSPVLITWKPTTKAEEEALAKEAEQVYRAYFEARLKYEAAGGFSGPMPQDLAQFLSGQAASGNEKMMHAIHREGVTLQKVELATTTRIAILPAAKLEPGAIVGLQFCDDARRVQVRKDDRTSQGVIMHSWPEFRRAKNGALVIIRLETQEVSKCSG